MKNFILLILLFTALMACKKQPSSTPSNLQIIVSNVDANTTYHFDVSLNGGVVLSAASSNENKTYTTIAKSGDTFNVNYGFTTKGQPVGVGSISFVYQGANRGTIANGSGSTNITIP